MINVLYFLNDIKSVISFINPFSFTTFILTFIFAIPSYIAKCSLSFISYVKGRAIASTFNLSIGHYNPADGEFDRMKEIHSAFCDHMNLRKDHPLYLINSGGQDSYGMDVFSSKTLCGLFTWCGQDCLLLYDGDKLIGECIYYVSPWKYRARINVFAIDPAYLQYDSVIRYLFTYVHFRILHTHSCNGEYELCFPKDCPKILQMMDSIPFIERKDTDIDSENYWGRDPNIQRVIENAVYYGPK